MIQIKSGKSDQDSAMSDMKVAEMVKQKKKDDYERLLREMENYPHCAILPSPEKLVESIGSPGSDKTDTLRDFDLVNNWQTNSVFLKSGLPSSLHNGGNLGHSWYYSLILDSFTTAFSTIRNSPCLELDQLVIWYYCGHGLSKKAAQKLSYSSTPNLAIAGCFTPKHHAAVAKQFVKEGRKVKGGELCLHRVGFCDLHGLLKPFILAVKSLLSNKNNHLAIILDQCYSGILAQELKDFEDEMNKKDPSFLQENSVTIQAACGPDEGTFGGYFTPCFVYLNDPMNAELLNDLIADWTGLTNEERNKYRSIKLPSPMVVTTRPQSELSQDATLELTVRNVKLTLFQDPGFFKFCSIMVYKHQDNSWFNSKERVLDDTSATDFMTSPTFNVIDYKLKKMATGRYAGSPMGLFLLEDPTNPDYAVCAHIHFQIGNTNNPQRINLVDHRTPPLGIVFYTEDHVGLTGSQIRRREHKIRVPVDANGWRLVKACRTYVESTERGSWCDLSQWSMQWDDLGVNALFRVKERQNQRSAWEDSYLEHLKKFDIPVVADN